MGRWNLMVVVALWGTPASAEDAPFVGPYALHREAERRYLASEEPPADDADTAAWEAARRADLEQVISLASDAVDRFPAYDRRADLMVLLIHALQDPLLARPDEAHQRIDTFLATYRAHPDAGGLLLLRGDMAFQRADAALAAADRAAFDAALREAEVLLRGAVTARAGSDERRARTTVTRATDLLAEVLRAQGRAPEALSLVEAQLDRGAGPVDPLVMEMIDRQLLLDRDNGRLEEACAAYDELERARAAPGLGAELCVRLAELYASEVAQTQADVLAARTLDRWPDSKAALSAWILRIGVAGPPDEVVARFDAMVAGLEGSWGAANPDADVEAAMVAVALERVPQWTSVVTRQSASDPEWAHAEGASEIAAIHRVAGEVLSRVPDGAHAVPLLAARGLASEAASDPSAAVAYYEAAGAIGDEASAVSAVRVASAWAGAWDLLEWPADEVPPTDAMAALERTSSVLLTKFPNNAVAAEARYALGMVRLRTGRFADAVAALWPLVGTSMTEARARVVAYAIVGSLTRVEDWPELVEKAPVLAAWTAPFGGGLSQEILEQGAVAGVHVRWETDPIGAATDLVSLLDGAPALLGPDRGYAYERAAGVLLRAGHLDAGVHALAQRAVTAGPAAWADLAGWQEAIGLDARAAWAEAAASGDPHARLRLVRAHLDAGDRNGAARAVPEDDSAFAAWCKALVWADRGVPDALRDATARFDPASLDPVTIAAQREAFARWGAAASRAVAQPEPRSGSSREVARAWRPLIDAQLPALGAYGVELLSIAGLQPSDYGDGAARVGLALDAAARWIEDPSAVPTDLEPGPEAHYREAVVDHAFTWRAHANELYGAARAAGALGGWTPLVAQAVGARSGLDGTQPTAPGAALGAPRRWSGPASPSPIAIGTAPSALPSVAAVARGLPPAAAARLLAVYGADTAAALNDAAVAAWAAGDPDQAVAWWREAAASDPAHAPTACNLGLVAVASGDATSALPWLERCGEEPVAHAVALRGTGAVADALAIWGSLPDDPAARAYRVETLVHWVGDLEQAASASAGDPELVAWVAAFAPQEAVAVVRVPIDPGHASRIEALEAATASCPEADGRAIAEAGVEAITAGDGASLADIIGLLDADPSVEAAPCGSPTAFL